MTNVSAFSGDRLLQIALGLKEPLPFPRGPLPTLLWPYDAPASLLGKLRTTRFLIQRLAAAGFGSEPFENIAGAVAHFLFLEKAVSADPTHGLLLLDGEGRCRCVVDLKTSMEGIRKGLADAKDETAESLILYHIRPGAALEALEEDADFMGRFHVPAEAMGFTIADQWLITNPASWKSIGPGNLPRQHPACPHVIDQNWRGKEYSRQDILDELAPFLSLEKWEMTGDLPELHQLAATPPESLSLPGLAAGSRERLAALLELSQRVGRAEAPFRYLLYGPEWLAHRSFDDVRFCEREAVWFVGYSASNPKADREPAPKWRLVPPDSLRSEAGLRRQAMRFGLSQASIFRLVPVCFHPEEPPESLAAEILSTIRQSLEAVGIRCDAALALSADGSWNCQGETGRLPTETGRR